jgi:AcrR family transcriptional regulator
MEMNIMKNGQRKKPEIRKKEIINAALSLFLETGYEKITMNEIALASGVAKGLCYHYFPSKEDLYQEALSDFVEQLTKDFLIIIKNKEMTLEERMDKMTTVLPSHQGKTLFYDFSRQQGNKRVYSDILSRLFNNLIPDLSQEYISYNNLPMEFEVRGKDINKFYPIWSNGHSY